MLLILLSLIVTMCCNENTMRKNTFKIKSSIEMQQRSKRYIRMWLNKWTLKRQLMKYKADEGNNDKRLWWLMNKDNGMIIGGETMQRTTGTNETETKTKTTKYLWQYAPSRKARPRVITEPVREERWGVGGRRGADGGLIRAMESDGGRSHGGDDGRCGQVVVTQSADRVIAHGGVDGAMMVTSRMTSRGQPTKMEPLLGEPKAQT